jgi:hypothetical protein
MSLISQFRDDAIRIVVDQPCTIMNGVRVYDENGKAISFDESLVEAEETKLRAEYDAQAYARSRKIEYDALNQLELMTDDAINGTTTHLDAINEIKAKYPKPE